jgi:hypothetical protein
VPWQPETLHSQIRRDCLAWQIRIYWLPLGAAVGIAGMLRSRRQRHRLQRGS